MKLGLARHRSRHGGSPAARRCAARLLVVGLAASLVVLAVGCGPGPARAGSGEVELRVTSGFGQRVIYATVRERVSPGETALSLLQSQRRVETGPGDRSVRSIDGIEADDRLGRRSWSYFVNGLEGDPGAADRRLSPGAAVQWDYRRRDSAPSVPAIVGAYPEPMLSGSEGKRLPVRVECANDRSRACRDVMRRLGASGVIASVGPFGDPAGESTIRVVVAPWSLARRVRAATSLEEGPRGSGVFARFREEGVTLELLDSAGRPARIAPPGTGLVAATALEGQQRVWLVTGVDEAGVERAAAALEGQTLRDRYAVAALPDGALALPLGGAEPR